MKETEQKNNSKISKNKDKKNSIKLYEIIFVVGIVALLVFILMTKDNNNLKAYCKRAVCNDDNTMCFTYEETKSGETSIIWKGDCSKIKK